MASTAAKVGSGRNKTFMAILIPVLVLFCAFNTFPLLTGFFYSFTDSKGYGAFNIIGIQNYLDLFSDARVLNSYLFTFKVAVVATLATNIISLMLAIGLSSKIKFKSALRGVYFVPASWAPWLLATCSVTSSPTSCRRSPAPSPFSRAPSGHG